MRGALKHKIMNGVFAAGLAFSLAACAATPDPADANAVAAYEEANDPLEPMNRAIFDFNMTIDKAFLRPVAEAYRTVLPLEVRNGLRNFINNLGEPITFANDLLQFDFDRAFTTLARFVVNTTVGIGGLGTPAEGMGLPYHEEDLGQTLAVWGFEDGPYLMAPLMGPYSLRHAVGAGVEAYANPVNQYLEHEDEHWAIYTIMGVDAVDARSRNIESFDEIERTAIDLYATVRTAYRQNRETEIRNGEADPDAGDRANEFEFDY